MGKQRVDSPCTYKCKWVKACVSDGHRSLCTGHISATDCQCTHEPARFKICKCPSIDITAQYKKDWFCQLKLLVVNVYEGNFNVS